MAQWVKNLPAMKESQQKQGQSLVRVDSLEEGMATHSSILTWKIPGTEKPCGLQSMGLQRVKHDCSNLAHTHTHFAPLQGQGEGRRAQCPEAPGASPAKRQAGRELGDELQRTQGVGGGRGGGCLPAQTPFPWRRAGAVNTELPQDRRASVASNSPNKPL